MLLNDRVDFLRGEVAIVTGAGAGIGRGIAQALAGHGASVIVATRTPKGGEETVGLIKKEGGNAVFYQVDVRFRQETDRLVDRAVADFGRVNILVNNAGINVIKPFLDLTAEDWQNLIDTNVSGVFFTSQRVARQMVAQGIKGRIINVSSIEAEAAVAEQVAYAGTKGAVKMMTKAMAIDLAPHGIRVNAVAPAYIRSNITSRYVEDSSGQQQCDRRVIAGRLGEPLDVGEAVAFLASPAAEYITGATLNVDGGWLAS